MTAPELDNPVDDDGGRVPLFDAATIDPKGRDIYLGMGETCLDCSSTALVGHWHTRTDCSVARTGWGGP